MGGVLVDQKRVVPLLYNNVGIVQLAHHAPGLLCGHGQFHLLCFLFRRGRDGVGLGCRFRRLGAYGRQLDLRLGGCRGNLGRDHRLPDGRHGGALYFGGGSSGGLFLGLRGVLQRGAEGPVFFRCHGAEEGFFFSRWGIMGDCAAGAGDRRSGLYGLRRGFKLHLGPVGSLV